MPLCIPGLNEGRRRLTCQLDLEVEEGVGAPLNGVQIFGREREKRSYPNLVGHANDVASLFSPFCSWVQGGLAGLFSLKM